MTSAEVNARGRRSLTRGGNKVKKLTALPDATDISIAMAPVGASLHIKTGSPNNTFGTSRDFTVKIAVGNLERELLLPARANLIIQLQNFFQI